jgi:putative membrane protein
MTEPDFDARAISRPDPALLRYYIVVALVSTVMIIPITAIVLLPLLFKFHTLRYRFDDEGVSMSWGVLFKREIQLTYRRIQDIHVTRNIFQRWMGLATVAVQTASGSSEPEMSIEGILEADALRDFLYSKMRGARGEVMPGDEADAAAEADSPATPADEALALLHEIRDELAAIRAAGPPRGEEPP